MLDSQNSDEIYNVVHDFHLKRHRIIRDRDSFTEEEQSSLGLYQTPSDDTAVDVFMESGDTPDKLMHADWYAR